ncbi:MAG TPA: hypothetical protein VIG99_28970 [Myxococcaceae bacterium]|jgi:hypothetical protein
MNRLVLAVASIAALAVAVAIVSCKPAFKCSSLCAGVCVDHDSDPVNCGSCGNHCAGGDAGQPGICYQGRCVQSCDAPTQQCGGTCSDLKTDPLHCGVCTNSCNGGSCQDGDCDCPGGVVSCPIPGTTTNTCADLMTSPANCGGCGMACGRGFLCEEGVCSCPAPAAICAGRECVNKNNDPGNCGGCGVQCGADQACQNGACGCRPGLSRCVPFGGGPPYCADTTSDPANCGACGNACVAGSQICSAGACVPATQSCAVGTTLCGSACVNLHTSAEFCGNCMTSCQRDQLCVKRSDDTFGCGQYDVAIGCDSCPCTVCLNSGRACCPSGWAEGVVYCVRDGCPSN